jgi:nitrate reductase NapE component
MPATEIRAADTDRTAVAEVLGRALHEGRLTVEEYDTRLADAYAARTHADLAALTTDLPTPAPSAPAAEKSYGSCGRGPAALRAEWRGYLTVALIVWAVYLASSVAGGFGYPWPVWVVGPWGAVLLARTLTTRGATAKP